MDQDLSDHFSWSEACITTHREFDNSIPKDREAAVRNTAKCMEKVRALLNNAGITVNSWYRSPEINHAVGGARSSQHILGEAVDFISPKYGTPLEIVRKISAYPELIPFDQLILEHTWVHISFCSIPGAIPRKQVLTLLEDNKSYAVGITDKRGNKV